MGRNAPHEGRPPLERVALATTYLLEHIAEDHDVFEFYLDHHGDRGFLTEVLREIGKRSIEGAARERVRHLLYHLLIDAPQSRREWVFDAMRDWPASLTVMAQAWLATDAEREIFTPTSPSSAELALSLASSHPAEVRRALAILAGMRSKEAPVEIAPFGLEVLERCGATAVDVELAFLRVVTRFRRFAPPLRRAARIRLVVGVLLRSTSGELAFAVADWLLEQGHAEEAVAEALERLVEGLPTDPAWDTVGADFVRRLVKAAPPRLREPLDAAFRARWSDPPRAHRDAIKRLMRWHEAAC